MDGLAGLVLALAVLLEADLPVHVQSVKRRSSLHEGPEVSSGRRERKDGSEREKHSTGETNSPVEEISVVRHKDVRPGFLNVIEPALN